MTQIQKEIYRIADLLGVKLSERDPRETYMWDTNTIGIGLGESLLSYSNQLHELGHWQVASPAQRKELDFGLGEGPETGMPVKRKMSVAESQKLEEQASLLGIAYEAYLGMDFIKTMKDHEWLALCGDGLFWTTIKDLQQKGLLEGYLPTVR